MSTINLKSLLKRIAYADAQLYVTNPVRYSTISTDDLINYACENSGIPKAQMASSFYALQQQIEQFVLNGHTLTLGTLGTLYLSAQTKAAKEEKDAGPGAVVRLSVKFRQSKKLKNILATTVRFATTVPVTGNSGNSGGDSSDNTGGDTGSGNGGSTGGSGEDGDNPIG